MPKIFCWSLGEPGNAELPIKQYFRHKLLLSNEIKVVERVRTKTMHCNFKDDIIYRKIIEKQSKHFNENLFRSQVRRNETNETDELRVHYHEVKKLDIRVLGRIQEISARMVRNFSVYPAEMDGVFMEELKLPDDKIALFLIFFGSEIEDIEARTETHIQIFPFFNVPHHPKYSEEPSRTAHVYGFQRNVEVAKDMLVTLCRVGREQKRENDAFRMREKD